MRQDRRPSKPVRTRLAAYVTAVGTLAAATLALALWRSSGWDVSEVLLAVAFVFIGILAERFPLHWATKSKADVSTAPLFAGALLLPPPLAILCGLLATLVSGTWRRRPPLETAFSAAEVSLEVGLAGLLFHSLTPAPLPAAATSPLGLLAVAGGASLFYLVNTTLVSGAISVQLGKGFMSLWLSAHRQVSAVEAMLFALGFLGALLAASYPWALLLVVPPLALCYKLLQGIAEKADLSDRLEQQLEQVKAYESELVQAAKLSSVGTLATGVAHEVNNPLFVIMGRAEMLLESPELYLRSPKATQHIRVIHDMTKRIESIVGGLLGYTRYRDESGPVDLAEAAEEVLMLVEHELKVRKVSVAKRWWHDRCLAWGNRSELQQVCMNLVMNAMDAMPQGGTLLVGTSAVDGKVCLSVSDTGTGMDQRVMDHLFEPFFTTKGPGRGTGLGLYLSRKIVERHHGNIAVDTQPTRGSRFHVALPRLAPEEAGRTRPLDDEVAYASRA